MEEIFPVIDDTGVIIASATRAECHSGSKILHPVVHLHLFNKAGEILLQKRSSNKDIQAGKWDTSVGGHVDYGESIEEALLREVKEELGITSFTPEFTGSYIFESEIEKEMIYAYKTIYEGAIYFNPDEIDEVRFWSQKEIESHLGDGLFTPNFENEWKRIKNR
jgi:isopentenyldiphosphate isomerase